MKPSQSLVDFIARHEGFRAVAYRPLPTDRFTIGYGSTFIKGKPVVASQTIQQEEALSALMADLEVLGDALSKRGTVAGLSQHDFEVSFAQNRFDAVISLVYNIGLTRFNNSETGTLFYGGHDISDRFELYNKSGGNVIPGLEKRRLQEKEIYVNGNYG